MNHRFEIKEAALEGLKIIRSKRLSDSRGFFERLFCIEEFKEAGFLNNILQINHSFSKSKGSVRGLHFQYPPFAEIKIIKCIRGQVFDVAVDVRKDSSTFLKWHGEILSENNDIIVLIPEGFAHGFQTLSDDAELIYFHSQIYNPDSEGGLNPFDPEIGIDWPLEVTEISEKDIERKNIKDICFKGCIL